MIYFSFPFLLAPECQIAAGLAHIPPVHTHALQRLSEGRLARYCAARFGLSGVRASRGGGINKCDLPLCYSARERGQRRRSRWPLVSLRAARCSRRPEPIVPEVEWNREAAGSVGTHTVFTIGKHTDTQSRGGQYDILSTYQAASVSWSSRPLTNSTESCGRSSACAAQPSRYS